MAKGVNGRTKKAKRRGESLYRSYNFGAGKDPVIARIRSLVQDEGLNNREIGIISGVSSTTLTNWFEGETRRPQYATIAAVTSSLGYKQEFVKAKELDFQRELSKARKEIEEAARRK